MTDRQPGLKQPKAAGPSTGGLDREAVRSRIDLAALIGARVPLKRSGDWWMGCCPFHGEKNPSFAVRQSKQTFTCFSGACGQHGDCFDWIMKTEGVDFPAALARLAALAGVEGTRRYARATLPLPERRKPETAATGGREFAARKIWSEGVAIGGTRGEAYLRARGLAVALPPTLRFHRGLKHGPSGLTLPAVLGAVCDPERKIVGVWRIFLDPKEPSKAKVEPNKMGLGRAAGCAVRLSPLTPTLAVAEGIETALAVLQMKPDWTVWSVLSASGFRTLMPPREVKRIAFCRDNDQASAVASMLRATELKEEGYEVACFTPEGPKGTDYLDLLGQAA